MEKSFAVKYHTIRGYCDCCGQKLENPIKSDLRKFHFSKESFIDWSNDWDEIVKCDDLKDVVEEFVYDTIQFFATNSYETIFIEDNEIEKAKQFVLSEVISNS